MMMMMMGCPRNPICGEKLTQSLTFLHYVALQNEGLTVPGQAGTASTVPGTLQSSMLDRNQVQNHIHNICIRSHSSSSFKGQLSPLQHSQVLMRKVSI